MNIFDLYGIKEVADVAFYDIATGAPVLYLDTLKVTTVEETSSSASANGGKGNSALIKWDFGKEITLTVEDALFSMKSMAFMHGAKIHRYGRFRNFLEWNWIWMIHITKRISNMNICNTGDCYNRPNTRFLNLYFIKTFKLI